MRGSSSRDEVAELVFYLCSPAAASITGADSRDRPRLFRRQVAQALSREQIGAAGRTPREHQAARSEHDAPSAMRTSRVALMPGGPGRATAAVPAQPSRDRRQSADDGSQRRRIQYRAPAESATQVLQQPLVLALRCGERRGAIRRARAVPRCCSRRRASKSGDSAGRGSASASAASSCASAAAYARQRAHCAMCCCTRAGAVGFQRALAQFDQVELVVGAGAEREGDVVAGSCGLDLLGPGKLHQALACPEQKVLDRPQRHAERLGYGFVGTVFEIKQPDGLLLVGGQRFQQPQQVVALRVAGRARGDAGSGVLGFESNPDRRTRRLAGACAVPSGRCCA